MAAWKVEVTAEVRALVVARDTPPGGSLPACVVCGEPVRAPEFHHRKRRGKGLGDGRPSNILPLHGRLEGGQCHHAAVHENQDPATAVARAAAPGLLTSIDRGWIISSYAPEAGYRIPLLCARRGLIVLLDEPGGDGRYWRAA